MQPSVCLRSCRSGRRCCGSFPSARLDFQLLSVDANDQPVAPVDGPFFHRQQLTVLAIDVGQIGIDFRSEPLGHSIGINGRAQNGSELIGPAAWIIPLSSLTGYAVLIAI